jgi:hypothetical protein
VTVNPSRTRELSINEIVKQAFVMAGALHYAQGLDTARGAYGRMLLETTMRRLEALGIQAKARSFVTTALTAGTDTYALDASVLDLIGPAQYIPAGTVDLDHADGESTLRLISAGEWQTLSGRSATGRPTVFFPDRSGALVTPKLWPIPDENGYIRFEAQLLLPDSTDGNATPGLERPWAQFFIFDLAAQIAESQSKPRDNIRDLGSKAEARRN